MPVAEERTYLSSSEQQEVIRRLWLANNVVPLKENIFFNHGDKISYLTLIASSFIFWRTGFRAYNLYKYGRGRTATLAVSLFLPANGALAHTAYCTNSLVDYYRSENIWTYGFRSALVHQIGLLMSLSSSLTVTFLFAQRSGILPIPAGKHRGGVRQVAFKLFMGKLKPYSKTIAMTFVTTTALMFAVGLCEYKQSCDLLAKQNRKTLSWKEY